MRRRHLKFRLRSADQLLLLDIPHSGGAWLYSILSTVFKPERVWPINGASLEDVLQEEGFEAVKDYKLLITRHDYSVYRYFSRKPVFITMLRHPSRRLESLYRELQQNPDYPLLNRIEGKGLTLNEFLAHPFIHDEIEIGQVRRLVGATQDHPGLSDQAMIEIAQLRLEEFAYFGIMEHLEESLKLLSYTFDRDFTEQFDTSPNTIKVEGEKIVNNEYQALLDLDIFDLRLYEAAKNKFFKRVKQMETEKRSLEKDRRSSAAMLEHHKSIPGLAGWFFRWRWTPAVGRVRRWLIPEGSRVEHVYIRLRRILLGW